MNQSHTNPHKDAELPALIEAVLNVQADDAQFAELERRLQNDAAARDTYATYMNLHCELGSRFAVEGDIVGLEAELERELREGELADFRRTLSTESMQRASRRSTLKQFFALATIAALVLAGLFVWNKRSSQDSAAQDTLAQVRDLEGEVTIIGASDTSAARIGDALRPGQRLRTAEQNARAVLEYPDGTTVQVHFGSVVQVPADGDVRLRLLAGSIEVDAAPQPDDRPLVFATDHARYVVLGTRFRLYRNEDATRLELNEGTVRLERQENDHVVESVEVEAGHVAVASADAKPVEVVPLAQGRATLQKTLAVTGQHVALSPAGDVIAVNDFGRGLRLCRAEDFEVQSEYKRDVSRSFGLAFGPDGQTVVRLSHDHVLLWKPSESEARKLPLAQRPARSRALSPDGRFVVMSSEEGIELSSIDFAAGELNPVAVLPNRNGKSGKAWSLAFSADGQRLAAGFWDGTVRVYSLDVGRIANLPAVAAPSNVSPSDATEEDRPSGKPLYTIAHEYRLAGVVIRVAITADGRYLAAFTNKAELQLINTATGEQQTLWESPGASAFSMIFSRDDRWLMAGGSDRTARLWSIPDGKPLLVINTEHVPQGMLSVPQRRLLITAGDSVKVWECDLP
ncbi:FecR domain-containing protein [Lignipirellula cremea]|uniref:Fec operon regulator FecR n=1 Tax=Lignipirellula cremea TaxID=2528010 RepID=A0A518DXM1_9BACT|nr:FecR domain-containing protein [Lignipirellula cremea]QDU96583.1 fec operon regulator FecR [Lignipirellula cremea]